ncbi:cellulose synthase, family GT2 [Tribonema minus]|uniref:Cellulose synthase, family GT2 n=1 Tax=Tribonema minus TaxID=303371 RepID=A0A835YHN4_9STRA|nr:cellulose synthase, family GT2 [Tribonema minus]
MDVQDLCSRPVFAWRRAASPSRILILTTIPTNPPPPPPPTHTPQGKRFLRREYLIWATVLLNLATAAYYLYWRVTGGSITDIQNGMPGDQWVPDNPGPIWVRIYAWLFFASEACLIIGIMIGHSQRLFAVQRTVVNMDDLALVDSNITYNARVSVFLPTAGEKPDVVLKALLGCMAQRGWGAASKLSYMRIIVLDEKKRKGVLALTAAAYKLAECMLNPELQRILQFEGVLSLNAIDVFAWWKTGGGHARQFLHDHDLLYEICAIMELMDDIAKNENGGKGTWGKPKDPSKVRHFNLEVGDKSYFEKNRATLEDIIMPNVTIDPGYIKTYESSDLLPRVIYYSRKEPGTPKVSPKAGNMNAAIFPIDYPEQVPLIGDSTIVVVDDCRHQLQPDFLQRTVPYFFELHKPSNTYTWAKVAFVQTPQRFPFQKEKDDPLGNHAAMQYDVINHGKDGIGAVGSSGHGSLWRVAALRGLDANGRCYADPSNLRLVGHKLGFRSEMLIEDTHTSLEMFRAGWRSVYINEPNENLSVCTHQPDNIAWRIKQVLRWHQGAVQLLWFKGPWYTTFSPCAQYPTMWHRLYGFDQCTYYMQAIPGYMLLVMPIVYGVTGQAPFSATIFDFFVRFIPFIVTAVLPTVILGNRPGVDMDRLSRDEQVWLSTTYIQMYAFFSMTWQIFTCAKAGDAWTVKAPTWPLFVAFYGEFLAILGGLFWLIYNNFQNNRIQNNSSNAAEAFNINSNKEQIRINNLRPDLINEATKNSTQLRMTNEFIISNLIGYPQIQWFLNFISVVASAAMAIFALWPMVAMQKGWKPLSLYQSKLVAYVIVGGMIIAVSGVTYFQEIAYGNIQSSLTTIG